MSRKGFATDVELHFARKLHHLRAVFQAKPGFGPCGTAPIPRSYLQSFQFEALLTPRRVFQASDLRKAPLPRHRRWRNGGAQ